MTTQNIGNEPIIVFLAKKKILRNIIIDVCENRTRDAITGRPEDYPTDCNTKYGFLIREASEPISYYLNLEVIFNVTDRRRNHTILEVS